jgi:enoyl-CoA hydratase
MDDVIAIAEPQAKPAATYVNVLYERLGAVARISHNRPAQRNAENTPLLDEMDAALREAIADPLVRVIVIAGVGDHFSAGHDLKEAMNDRSLYTVEQRWEYEATRYYGYSLRIWDCPKPTIAQVQGACVGGAFMVANMCDLVVASDEAYFSDPVCQTLAAAAVEVLVHPWVMGLRTAKEFLYTGERMPAAEAHRIGMVNRVTPRAELEAETLALAEKIARTPPFALQVLKRSLNRTADIQGFRNALSAHFDTHQVTHVTDETRRIREDGAGAAISRGRN